MTPHLHPVRVYYEDTDLAGIVYYANYLKFIERGRTEALRDAGVDQGALKAGAGLVFAVVRVSAEWLSPARFDDLLAVETRLERLGGASVDMEQRVLREGRPLFRAAVRLACMGADGRAARLPDAVRAALGG